MRTFNIKSKSKIGTTAVKNTIQVDVRFSGREVPVKQFMKKK